MASFTKYTPLDLSDPSLAHQVVTEMTEDLFCGVAVEPIFVAEIQQGGQRADDFDKELHKFFAKFPAQCKADSIAPSNLWEALEDCSISKSIADAISAYVHALAAYRGAMAAGDTTAADAVCADLMWFEEDVVEGRAPTAPGARATAPKFKLDSMTARVLVKAYEGLSIEGYTKILNHKSYFEFVSVKLSWVLKGYAHRVMRVFDWDQRICVHKEYVWSHEISSVPPHLFRFTPYQSEQNTSILSLFKSKKDQLRPGYVRMHWSCNGIERHLDIPQGSVKAIKAAIATAPKVPYLASEKLGTVQLFVHSDYPERWE